MKKKLLSDEDVKTLRAARNILRRVSRRIAKLDGIREKTFDETSNRWKDATEELYGVMDEMYRRGRIDSFPDDGMLFLRYRKD